MTMTKKDFIGLADVIRAHNAENGTRLGHICGFTHDEIKVLAKFCSTQNHRFNQKLWEEYIAGKVTANGKSLKTNLEGL